MGRLCGGKTQCSLVQAPQCCSALPFDLVVVAFALLSSTHYYSPVAATSALCLLLSDGCFIAASAFAEAPLGAGINRWHEGAAFL
jgi:hypothetical protein